MRRVFRIPFRRPRLDRELDDELGFHLEARTNRLIAAGRTPADARAEALRQFGDVESVRRNCLTLDQERESSMNRASLLAALQQDVVFGVRTLRRNLGFSAVIVGALAVGIGANTAIFTLVDAVVLRGLPVDHPEQLVAIGAPTRVNSFSQGTARTDLLSYALYRDLRLQNRSFSDVLASGRAGRVDARIDGTAGELEHPRGRFVSANYFSVLGLHAQAGRAFDPHIDDVAASGAEVVISDGYWSRRFSRDPTAVGRSILVDDARMTIVGVAPAGFAGEIVGQTTDLWLPASMHDVLRPNPHILTDRTTSWLLAMGRLRPGVTLAQATADVSAVLGRSIIANPAGPTATQSFLANKPKYYVSDGSRGFSSVRATFTTPLYALLVGVGLLLCIICANVANMLLARAIARGREMAIRLAIGAHRSRLVRQLLTESALLAALSAGGGLLIAWWGSRALIAMTADGTSLSLSVPMDASVLVFTLVVSVLAVGLFGAVPALRASRIDIASSMRGGAASVSGGLGARGSRAPLGKLLIAGQVALSTVLLVGAAMLVHGLRSVEGVDVGMDRDHLLIADVDIQARGYEGARLANLVHSIRDRVAAIPGVTAVTFSENGVFSGTESQTTFELPGFVAKSPSDTLIAYDLVGPAYVAALGAKLAAGREFRESDESGLPRIGLLNQSAAAFLFQGNAIGKYLHFNDTVAVEIIGVVADTRDHQLDTKPDRRIYFSYVHADDPKNLGAAGSLRFEIRTAADPDRVAAQVRRAIAAVDQSLPINSVTPLATLMRQSIREARVLTRLATAFGVLALLLAAVGLYGVMTYAMTRRRGEIGLRIALGAQTGDVIRMVLVDGLSMVVTGAVVGIPLALAATRLLRAHLTGVEAANPLAIAGALAVLAASAIVATLVPAARASRVAPGVALKAD